jgi:hypothetical protein
MAGVSGARDGMQALLDGIMVKDPAGGGLGKDHRQAVRTPGYGVV